MANFYHDNDDFRFYIEKGIDWERLFRFTEYNDRNEDRFKDVEEAREFYRSILELVGQFAADEVAPHVREIDAHHPTLENGIVRFPPVADRIFDQLRELGLHGLCIPRELGGLNAPFILFMLANELLARADVSITAHNGFHGGMAMAMLLYSIKEGSTTFAADEPRIEHTRFEEEIAKIVAGKAWGSMDITEPDAGSDMGALRTVGEQDAQGSWYVTGQKIFITSGHAKYHFVIARTEERGAGDDALAGLSGLSMFLVKAFDDDAQGNRTHHALFEKLEDKLGHHGSATVAVRYDRTPARLIGRRGEGFKQMLLLMNNARVGVGFEALGLCEAAWRLAREYAAQRPSMGKSIDRHEMIADYLDEMHTDIQGIRALAVEGAFHEEMSQKLGLLEELRKGLQAEALGSGPLATLDSAQAKRDQRRHQATARRLTPLVKYLASEKAVELARRNIQIHGGYGYSTEFGAEKLLRDAMVLPIYEGTSQIQSLMAMKDTLLGVLRNPKRFVEDNARALWRSRSAPGELERRIARLQLLQGRAVQYLMTRLAGQKLGALKGVPMDRWLSMFKQWNPKRDFAPAMLHAEHLTRILADVAICELLLEQSRLYPERQEVLERYLERAEPRCRYHLDLITTTGDRILSQLSETQAPSQKEVA